MINSKTHEITTYLNTFAVANKLATLDLPETVNILSLCTGHKNVVQN